METKKEGFFDSFKKEDSLKKEIKDFFIIGGGAVALSIGIFYLIKWIASMQ